jgi:hypothetical protein
MTHPTLLSRYRALLRIHRSVLPPGELTAIRQLEALDPEGVLSLALEIGERRAMEILRTHTKEDPC